MATIDGNITDLLESQLSVIKSVLSALQVENDALTRLDIEAIEAAASAKNTRIDQQLEQQQRLNAWLEQHGQGQSLAAAVAALGAEHPAGELVVRLQQIGNECQTLNRNNGALVNRLQERTQNALKVLRQSDQGSETYSITGGNDRPSDSHSLGKA